MPSSDHCCTETVQPSSDHDGTTKVVPPSDHLHTKITSQRKLTAGKNIHQKPSGLSVKYRRPNGSTDHAQIWQACADRSGNGSYLNNWPHEWPGRVGSLGPSFEARQLVRARHLTYPRYTAKL